MSTGDFAGHRVQGEVGERHGCRLGVIVGLGAAQQRPHAGQQLFEGEWLRQIVIGARIQAGDPFGDGIAGGEDQNRQVVAGAAELAADLQPIQARHHHIQDQRIRSVAGNHGEGLDTVMGQLDRVAIEGE